MVFGRVMATVPLPASAKSTSSSLTLRSILVLLTPRAMPLTTISPPIVACVAKVKLALGAVKADFQLSNACCGVRSARAGVPSSIGKHSAGTKRLETRIRILSQTTDLRRGVGVTRPKGAARNRGSGRHGDYWMRWPLARIEPSLLNSILEVSVSVPSPGLANIASIMRKPIA
ncbi:hypothetical protein GALL_536600 [mine drainage metagenome]|uniref:Uncharacterized protein n=1 Tax=mine drainage metagenome TaxID=410659 RepID=A0A1J5PBD1_9ZZZZ